MGWLSKFKRKSACTKLAESLGIENKDEIKNFRNAIRNKRLRYGKVGKATANHFVRQTRRLVKDKYIGKEEAKALLRSSGHVADDIMGTKPFESFVGNSKSMRSLENQAFFSMTILNPIWGGFLLDDANIAARKAAYNARDAWDQIRENRQKPLPKPSQRPQTRVTP